MAIEPFKIVNEDGSINESEYNRCVQFLNEYVNGQVKVYTQISWTDPVEVDMTREEDALTILKRYLNYDTNKLLNARAFSNIKRLFQGILNRYGSSIHTYGRYLEQSQNFTDGAGYVYDVLGSNFTPVITYKLSDNITAYYLDDTNHTVVEFNDTKYSLTNTNYLPTANFPDVTFTPVELPRYNDYGKSKATTCGVYSDFQRLAGQYVGSSTLFYYSECNDILYTTGGSPYSDNRLGEVINFNYKQSISNKSKPTRGVDLSKVAQAQQSIYNIAYANAFLPPSIINPSVPYLKTTDLTAKSSLEWINE